jgi:outer membrane protein TolC
VDSTVAVSDSGSQPVPGKWWISFGKEQLNTVVDSAFTSNSNLKNAWQRLHATLAVVDRESSFLFPDRDASLQGEVSRPRNELPESQKLQLGFTSEYEIDLWWQIRTGVPAA